ncbi:MAG TPA: GMP synthase [Phnomibacter sp.]|nr:GMP synthase [Phnomibacter sp.]
MIKLALLDLYDGFENQGMRGIRDIVARFSQQSGLAIQITEYDVRQKNHLPDLSYDVYISSGGPGSPLDSAGEPRDDAYMAWLQQLDKWNKSSDSYPKKHAFFICHSFQLACRYYQVGEVCKRKSTSFGIFPIHRLQAGSTEPVFANLKDPFYAVDSRDFQLIKPNHSRIKELGGAILCIEKDRPHVPLERAIMAIRFNEYFIGTQFHPEADAQGMAMYLRRQDKKETVIANHGLPKWESMLEHLEDPDKIVFTQHQVLPNFLAMAVEQVVPVSLP